MAAKMAAGANKNTTFEQVDLESSVIPLFFRLTCYEQSVFGGNLCNLRSTKGKRLCSM